MTEMQYFFISLPKHMANLIYDFVSTYSGFSFIFLSLFWHMAISNLHSTPSSSVVTCERQLQIQIVSNKNLPKLWKIKDI